VTKPVFELTGGALCLDFINTVDNRPTSHRKEMLPDYRHLVRWSVQAITLSGAEAAKLTALADRLPAGTTRTLKRMLEVREALFSVFAAAAEAEPPPLDDTRILNEAIRRAFRHLRLRPATAVYQWQWQSEPLSLERLLWPVVRSAAELLTSADLSRLRQCDAANCGWLFLDTSKSQSRRWCNMRVCGNRNKARRYRAAKRLSRRAVATS